MALGVEYRPQVPARRQDIIHAIQAHHGDVECKTLVACLVQAADAISAARPGARRENLENYIKRLEKLEEIAGTYPGVEKSYAIQAGREVRVMVKPEQVSEDQMVISGAGPGQEDRERAGIPRPDQGSRPAGDQGRGIRKIQYPTAPERVALRSFFWYNAIIRQGSPVNKWHFTERGTHP